MFPGLRGGMLGANAVSVALATAGINATGHGFRTSFKDWRGTRAWRSCSRSSRWRTSKDRRPWRRKRAMTCSKSGDP